MKKYEFGLIFSMLLLLASTAHGAEGNDVVLSCKGAQTTLDRQNCENNATGKIYVFEGQVADIMEANYAKIQLSSGQYAKVRFTHNVAESLKKGLKIQFSGLFSSFGTGILFSHKIDEAELR
jgi:hypothetical protein